jgi:hypothetical protein
LVLRLTKNLLAVSSKHSGLRVSIGKPTRLCRRIGKHSGLSVSIHKHLPLIRLILKIIIKNYPKRIIRIINRTVRIITICHEGFILERIR